MVFSPTTGVSAARSGVPVVVTWSNPGGTQWNDVWRQTEGEDPGPSGRGVCVGSVLAATTTFTDAGAPAAKRVRYRVYAGSGPRSNIDWSNDSNTSPTSWVPVAAIKPPTGLVAKRVGSNVVLTWASESQAFTTGAVIQESTNGGTSWATLASPSGAGMVTYTHTGASQAGTHMYRVALSATGLSTSAYGAPSNLVGIVAPPNAPTGLTVTGGAFDPGVASVFSWTHNPADTTDQSKFEIQYRVQGAGSWTSAGVTTSAVSSTTFAASTFTVGVYEWQVRTTGLHATASPWSATALFTVSRAPVAGIVMANPWPSSVLTGSGSYSQPDGVPIAEVSWTVTTTGGAILAQASGQDLNPTFPIRLANGDTVVVSLQVRSTDGVWSSTVTVTLPVSYAKPAAPVVTAVPDIGAGLVQVSLSNPGGSPAAVSVDILRDGEIIATVPPGGSWTDRLPPLGRTCTYTAVATSALPSMSSPSAGATTTVTGPKTGIWLNAGDGFEIAAQIAVNPNVDWREGVEKTLARYRGRRFPVGYTSTTAEDTTGTITGHVYAADLERLQAVTSYRDRAWLRDPDGRSFEVQLGDLQYQAGAASWMLVPVSILVTRTG
ncbi:hypothetical protein [uncultured Microbacterium sp.]|uniref:hypothetical protein n=1 Tax=uncultured Microbacterium sp. TaxID=191216 RepID=UPI0025F46B8B|nr:hypothetical protein [uncultured Microbacterium sp.]